MSTIDERRERASTGVALRDEGEWRDGFARPRVFLMPIAAPSVLGLAGFSVATAMVAIIQAGWLGTPADLPVVGLFAATFGGIGQFMAGMWSYRARDAVATLAHGMWGSFWMAFGIVAIFMVVGDISVPAAGASNYALGFWFFGLAYMTAIAAIAATFDNIGIAVVLWTLAAGSALTAAGWFQTGIGGGWLHVGGWLFVISAASAAYMVMALLFVAATGRTILPVGAFKKDANIPGRKPMEAIQLPWAEPGVKQGQ
ncbi:MAG TPA: GPR1/FUN34/YaaH family transporter [Gaiellaceae bacterium]|jgi:succinate-acetate transporter protein|nr:GPR1/FUN34/YaaH family transporter [Gaiellaceae bacterium]